MYLPDSDSSGFGRISPTIIGLCLILLSTIYYFIELPNVRHGFDQSYQAYLAMRMLDGGEWITIGQPSSVFLDNPPLMAYITALPLLISRSIWSVYIFICLLNAAAVWFVYDVARHLIGPRVAVVAGVLFATNPWIIHFGRMPWTQALLPFFMAAIAWGIWPTLVRKPCQPRRFLFGVIMTIAMMQTYILGIALAAPLGLLMLIYYRRIPRREIIIGIVLFVVSFGFFGYQLSRIPGTSGSKFSEFAAQLSISFEPIAIWHALRFVTGGDYWGADIAAAIEIPAPPLALVAHWVLLVAVCVGIVRALADLRTPSKRSLALVLLVWFGVPTIGLSLIPFLIHPHYLMMTLPAGHLLAGYALMPLLQHKQLRWAVALIALMIVGQWRVNLWRSGQAVAANPIYPGMNGWALKDAADFGRNLHHPANSARISAPDHPSLTSTMAGRLQQQLEDIRYPNFVLLPATQPAQYILREQAADPTLPLTSIHYQNDYAQIVRTTPHDRSSATALPETVTNRSSDAGLSLLGYTLPATQATGQPLTLSTYWYVDELKPERAEWYVGITYQLFDANGSMRLNTSQHGMWARDWQQNDLLIERATLDLPADLPFGDYTLLVILFDPIHNITFYMPAPDGQFNVSIPIAIK